MNPLAHELLHTIEDANERLLTIPETQTQKPHVDGAWSAKQVLGHLIDSAANNHARFVRAQFTDDLLFGGYDQEQWITAQSYDDEDWLALVQLWLAYNRHLAHVIAHIPAATLTQIRTRHTLNTIAWQTISADTPTTLDYLISDYIGHLKAHLEQLFASVEA